MGLFFYRASCIYLLLTGHVIVTAHSFPSRHLHAPPATFPLSGRRTAATAASVALPLEESSIAKLWGQTRCSSETFSNSSETPHQPLSTL